MIYSNHALDGIYKIMGINGLPKSALKVLKNVP